MNTLIEDVRTSFEREVEERGATSPIQILTSEDTFPPGFREMREYYTQRITAYTRRGYRHFAGSDMPDDADRCIELTGEVMLDPIMTMLFEAFCDGVQVGQRVHLVAMADEFDRWEPLFFDDDFREQSHLMAAGFSDDRDVAEYFMNYLADGLGSLIHATGYAHSDAHHNKVWDIWVMLSTATISASYVAGHRMGDQWREREMITDLEIALEGGPDGIQPAGEDD